jgi:hypothetical protein
MLIVALGLAPATKRALRAAGIKNTDQLQRPANELLTVKHITGAVVYDVGRRLQAHGLGLRTNTDTRRCALPTEDDLEMLRLRVVEGLALRDIAAICGVSPERVRQRLNLRFGLSGDPPAVLERRRTRVLRRPDWERIIATRLRLSENGLPMAVLLRGFADSPLAGQAPAAIGRMEVKGLLNVQGDHVRPTGALSVTARSRVNLNDAGRGIGSARAGPVRWPR